MAVLLALRRPLLDQLHGVLLDPLRFYTGEGPACTFNADGSLDDLQLWAGIHKPPHQAKEAVRKGIARPQLDYEALHGLIGRLM